MDDTLTWIKEGLKKPGKTQRGLARAMGIDPTGVSRMLAGNREIKANEVPKIRAYLGAPLPKDDFHKGESNQNLVEGETNRSASSLSGNERTGGITSIPTEPVYLIGQVQAGAWRVTYQLQKKDWKEMYLPVDPLFPGVKRYMLENVGESMNRTCHHGGFWVFVSTIGTGIGAQPSDYVIVERRRWDGLFEATCKQLQIRDGEFWLFPDSTDASFKPFPMKGDDEVKEILIVGLVTSVINRPGKRL